VLPRSENLPVSVIICARNEEVNIEKNLKYILEQDYTNFEVVVVNDCSNDNSDLILREYSSKYPHLKVVTVNEHERFKTGKKFAVTMGIKAAQNENLLFTDADCRPASLNWIRRMQENFSGSTEIVLGFSPYERLSGFVNLLIRFETFFTALNYLSFALARKPYMGVGRNMAYTKTLFFKGKGFASHMHIPSGDDDLFVNQNANTKNTVIEIDTEAQVWSEPKKTIGTYLKQKLRHLGAGKAYKAEHKRMLTLQSGSAMLFYTLLIALVVLKADWWFLLSLYFVRLLALAFVYFPIFKKLNYDDLKWWLPLFDFIYYFYILALSLLTIFKKKVQWK
jgi:glycosyltransferase involved in cell wall biosynthesis